MKYKVLKIYSNYYLHSYTHTFSSFQSDDTTQNDCNKPDALFWEANNIVFIYLLKAYHAPDTVQANKFIKKYSYLDDSHC